jgi:hypothetical protein
LTEEDDELPKLRMRRLLPALARRLRRRSDGARKKVWKTPPNLELGYCLEMSSSEEPLEEDGEDE